LPDTTVKDDHLAHLVGRGDLDRHRAVRTEVALLEHGGERQLSALGAENVFLENGQPWPWQLSVIFEPLGRWLTVSSSA
jgi:hypothetical protein